MRKGLWLILLSLVTGVAGAHQKKYLVVALDGSGDYTSLQKAIDAAPSNSASSFIIYIREGRYQEKVMIPKDKPNLCLIGQRAANTIITWDDYSGKPDSLGGAFHTSNSATVTVMASGFVAMEVTFENSTGYHGDGPQALAINVNADRCAFDHCRFIGGQDTLLTWGKATRQYFKDCYIDGNTDFIFGSAIAVFDSCVIYPRDRLDGGGQGYITAANTPAGQRFGFVFRDCKIMPNTGVTTYTLGRPWQNDSRTTDAFKKHNKVIFLHTRMARSILPQGWSLWNQGTNTRLITFAEYKSQYFDGSLIDTSLRVPWSRQLTDSEAAVYYHNADIFGAWDPSDILSHFPDIPSDEIAMDNFYVKRMGDKRSISWNLCWPVSGVSYAVYRGKDSLHFKLIRQYHSSSDTLVAFNLEYRQTASPAASFYYYLLASKAGLKSAKTRIMKN